MPDDPMTVSGEVSSEQQTGAERDLRGLGKLVYDGLAPFVRSPSSRPLRAISVRQPWAWAIVYGGKDVENRGRPQPWKSAVGERIAIHAAKTVEYDDLAEVERLAGMRIYSPTGSVGALIGLVTIQSVHTAIDCYHGGSGRHYCSKWAQPDQWHIMLADVTALPDPIPCRGALGLFDVVAALTAKGSSDG